MACTIISNEQNRACCLANEPGYSVTTVSRIIGERCPYEGVRADWSKVDNWYNDGEEPNHVEYENETFETWEKLDKDSID